MALRVRIAISMLSVVAISGCVSTFIGGCLLRRDLVQEARSRARHNLHAAEEFYSQRLRSMEAALLYTALGERFCQAVAEGDVDYLSPRLAAVRKEAGLDFLSVMDGEGRVIYRTHHPSFSGDLAVEDPLISRVLKGADIVSGTILTPIETLRKENSSLAERSSIRLLPSPKAKPTDLAQLDAGMMMCAATAVKGPGAVRVGVLRAGILLNRNDALVDQVQNTVFRDERYRGELLGVATVFQGDVRVSTLLTRENGSRAIGSRSSAELWEYVFRDGESWVGSTWVFDRWYIAAHAPIRDIDGKVIGMLGVGVREQQTRDATLRTLTLFGLVTLAGLGLAAIVAWKLAHGISRPISDLAAASTAVAQGDFQQLLPVNRTDEVGALTQAFNLMAQSLKERDDLLKEKTRLQLTRSERLASIGRLAAGVAHEINNPLTGVVTFAHMLHKDTVEGSQQHKDAATIIEAATRCQKIVRGLLNFSRQNEPRKTFANLGNVLHCALDLTRNQAQIGRVKITEDLDPNLPPLVMDADQIEEVAVNVIVNAIDAMSDGGRLVVRTRASQRDGTEWAEFEIADTGKGIPPENVERIFDPFFTTKQTGKGTGLGLAVSYGIVAEHGGHIDVTSVLNRGTTFTVRLPVTPKEPADGRQAADPCD